VSRQLILVMIFAIATLGCSPAQPARDTKPAVQRIPASQTFAGFLKDYTSLKPNPHLDGDALTFAAAEAKQNLRSYFAIIVDPVEVYIATDADANRISETSRIALTTYFQHALIRAVSDAFPVVDSPGPLTLRLRTALVGVDVGTEQALSIGKVGVEMELVDSKTGERIAAMVDKANLGAGAEVGSREFSRGEKFAAAREALDEWASRLRTFLDAEHELEGEDAERADRAYHPYGAEQSRL
jgi:hypothetical protein